MKEHQENGRKLAWPGRGIAPGMTTIYLGHWSKKTQNALKNRVVRLNYFKTRYSDEMAVRSHLTFVCGHPVWRNVTLYHVNPEQPPDLDNDFNSCYYAFSSNGYVQNTVVEKLVI